MVEETRSRSRSALFLELKEEIETRVHPETQIFRMRDSQEVNRQDTVEEGGSHGGEHRNKHGGEKRENGETGNQVVREVPTANDVATRNTAPVFWRICAFSARVSSY